MGALLTAVHVGLICVVFRAMLGFVSLPLSESLGFYGAYHQDPVNQAIHFLFVPTLLFSFLVYFAHHPLPVVPQLGSLSTLLSCAYGLFYVVLDPKGGVLYCLLQLIPIHAAAMYLVGQDRSGDLDSEKKKKKKSDDAAVSKSEGTKRSLRIAGFLQVLGWYMQIHPGHAVYEGAKPALLDSLGQSLSVAPLFAFYEGLWAAGLFQELHAETKSAVVRKRAELCRAGGSFRFC